MPLELTLAYFTPILAFLLVFTLVYAILNKTKVLGENAAIHSFLSLLIALIFVIAPAARLYALEVMPWLVVFLTLLFFFLLIIGFFKGNIEDLIKNKLISTGILIVLLAIFLISGIHVFGSLLQRYLSYVGLNLTDVRDIILHPAVLSLLVLFVIAAVLSFWFKKK